MKVILLAELKGRGGEGDVIDVARGFANNYLLPAKIAIEATPGNLKQLEQRRHNIKKREEVRMAEAGDFRGVLDGKKVTIQVKVGEAGRLFGSVTASMVAEAIKEQLGVDVDRRKIETHGIIKTVGDHKVEIAVYRDIKADLDVEVKAEGVVEQTAEEAELAAEIAAAEAGTDTTEVTEVEATEVVETEDGTEVVEVVEAVVVEPEEAPAAEDAAPAETEEAPEAE
jgi:large subunit ribosomal protein L9